MVLMVESGTITPPLGLNIVMLKSITSASLSTIYCGVLPFVAADFVKSAILVLVPASVMWLPSTMYRQAIIPIPRATPLSHFARRRTDACAMAKHFHSHHQATLRRPALCMPSLFENPRLDCPRQACAGPSAAPRRRGRFEPAARWRRNAACRISLHSNVRAVRAKFERTSDSECC